MIQTLVINNTDLLRKINIGEQLNVNDRISVFKDYIKNQVFTSRSSLSPKGQDTQDSYINLQELLNDMSSRIFNYIITINNQQVAGHGTVNTKNSVLTEEYRITDDLICNVSLQINPGSAYAVTVSKKIYQQTLNLISISCFFFLCTIFLAYYLLNRFQKIKTKTEQLTLDLSKTVERNKNIILFKEKDKAFILKCYQYSKTISDKSRQNQLVTKFIGGKDENYGDEYLPLPLTTEKEPKPAIHKLSLHQIIADLQDYFDGYVAYSNTKMTLEVTNNVDKITVPFNEEIFIQIIISLFCNILYFNKDLEKLKYIKLLFKKNTIACSSNGFLLDHNLAIRYSEKIFDDTGNLYLLSLGQVFVLLKKYGIDYTVLVKNNETIIEIKFRDEAMLVSPEKKKGNEVKIINLNKFKKKKHLK